MGRSSFIWDKLQWTRSVSRTRAETRRRRLDECRSFEANGGGLQSKTRVEQGSKVVATKEELEGCVFRRREVPGEQWQGGELLG